MSLSEGFESLEFQETYDTAQRIMASTEESESQPDTDFLITSECVGFLAIIEAVDEDPDGVLDRAYTEEEKAILFNGVLFTLAVLTEIAKVKKLKEQFPDIPKTFDADED